MSESSFLIREIQPQDNLEIERIIKAIIIEFGLPEVGTAFEDKETAQMFESFQEANELYLILEENDMIVGGAGIKPLKDFESDVCELQKMYFIPEARGKGYGRLMIDRCLSEAKKMGYTKCYLESASQLKAAIHLYDTYGFERLNKAIGNTGHYSCGVWMIKTL